MFSSICWEGLKSNGNPTYYWHSLIPPSKIPYYFYKWPPGSTQAFGYVLKVGDLYVTKNYSVYGSNNITHAHGFIYFSGFKMISYLKNGQLDPW